MRLPNFIADRLLLWALRRVQTPPSLTITQDGEAYLHRWYVLPRNPLLNLYLHQFLRSDSDRAHHDHPWSWCSIMLLGGYLEERIHAGGIITRTDRAPGDVTLRLNPRAAHRVVLHPAPDEACYPAMTLFFTGPRVRLWGFHCPAGWRPWHAFTSPDGTDTGKGCD